MNGWEKKKQKREEGQRNKGISFIDKTVRTPIR